MIHNFGFSIAFAFGQGSVEFIGVSVYALGGLLGVKLLQDKQKGKSIQPEVDLLKAVELNNKKVVSGGQAPKKPDDEDDKKRHPNGKYDCGGQHGNKKMGRKNPAPKNGQRALDKSFKMSKTSDRRLAVDNGDFVVLDKTRESTYHGHTRSWKEMGDIMQKEFRKRGLAKRNGKII